MPLEMRCPECGVRVVLEVDGEVMSEETLLHLPRAPKTITRHMIHKVWCTKRREDGSN